MNSVSMLKATGHFAGAEVNKSIHDHGTVIQGDSPTRRANPDLVEAFPGTNPQSLASTTGSKQMTRNLVNQIGTPDSQQYRSNLPVTFPLSPISGITANQGLQPKSYVTQQDQQA